MRLRALVEYDGTGFAGFQLQAHRGAQPRTVQGVLEAAIVAAIGQQTRVIGAGRTDAGVHAAGQTIHFDTEAPLAADLPTFQRAVNAHLPQDVAVRGLEAAPESFHARFSASSRSYCYSILNAEVGSPLLHRMTYHVKRPLAVERMNEAAQHLVGTHDFVAFAAEENAPSTVREVYLAQVCALWAESAPIWHTYSQGEVSAHAQRLVIIEVEANAFLRHMMRRIAGTLVRVGAGRLEPGDVASILAQREKRLAGPTAPARGLCLRRVRYDSNTVSSGGEHKRHAHTGEGAVPAAGRGAARHVVERAES